YDRERTCLHKPDFSASARNSCSREGAKPPRCRWLPVSGAAEECVPGYTKEGPAGHFPARETGRTRPGSLPGPGDPEPFQWNGLRCVGNRPEPATAPNPVESSAAGLRGPAAASVPIQIRPYFP